MTLYRLYWLGADGRINRAENIECVSGEGARTVAIERKGAFPAIEIWLKARQVARIGAPEVPDGKLADADPSPR